MPKVIRSITYESSSDERMQGQMEKSLADGEHQFGDMKITVTTVAKNYGLKLPKGVTLNGDGPEPERSQPPDLSTLGSTEI